ncbi:MAG TPA: sigma-54 dependent transcriptional regulator [Acidobacteriota bacterium]|nr:sigma-54 dependent transcriptional regulator [Acidobacteriota bacterium]
MKRTILVVDDEKLIRWSLDSKLRSWGYEVETAEDAQTAIGIVEERLPDLVLLDIKLPDGDGVDVLERIRELSADMAVIMITAEGTVETAVRAMKLGAYDYLSKPFDLAEMRILIEKALEHREMKRSLDYFQAEKRAKQARDRLIGESPRFMEVVEFVRQVAASPTEIVLLLGESGTGKNVVARAIHNQSERADRPFVTIECTSIPEQLLESELFGHEKGAFTDARATKKGLLELAKTGTVFIDEIGDLPLSMQAKLLRVIEDKRFKRVGGVVDFEVDARIIVASNKNLAEAVNAKLFRADLYFRLNVVPIHLPPLREREHDIIVFAEFFMERFNRQFNKSFTSISDAAARELLTYPWPGNVRELRNAMERAILLGSGDELEPEHFVLDHGLTENAETTPSPTALPAREGQTLDEFETDMIRRALEEADGNQTQAARSLGISRDVLRYRMKKYGLSHA